MNKKKNIFDIWKRKIYLIFDLKDIFNIFNIWIIHTLISSCKISFDSAKIKSKKATRKLSNFSEIFLTFFRYNIAANSCENSRGKYTELQASLSTSRALIVQSGCNRQTFWTILPRRPTGRFDERGNDRLARLMEL